MSKWLNTEVVVEVDIEHPCNTLKYCPYGQLVEEFPLDRNGDLNCGVFGHHCPVHYHMEEIKESLSAKDEANEERLALIAEDK